MEYNTSNLSILVFNCSLPGNSSWRCCYLWLRDGRDERKPDERTSQSPGWTGTAGCEVKAQICGTAQKLWYKATGAKMIYSARWKLGCAALHRVCLQSLNYPPLQKARHMTKGSLAWVITAPKLAVALQKWETKFLQSKAGLAAMNTNDWMKEEKKGIY